MMAKASEYGSEVRRLLRVGERIEFESLYRNLYCGWFGHSCETIRNEESLEWMWTRFTRLVITPPPPPVVDFSKDILICAFRGKLPATGYTTEIKWIVEREGFLWVVTAQHDPTGVTRLDWTQPYDIVRLPDAAQYVRPIYFQSLRGAEIDGGMGERKRDAEAY